MAASRENVALRLAPVGIWNTASLLLGVLLLYLLLGQLIDPGFTDFWGFQVAQVSLTLATFLIDDVRHRRNAVWGWETRAIVVATTYAISIGTAGHLFDRFASYDKFTHFGSGAAVAALCYESVAYLRRHRKFADSIASTALFAIGFSIFVGIVWEVYEYLGSAAFHALRTQSWDDTYHDLIADSAGAILATLLLARRR